MNTILKGSITVVLGLCSVCAFATDMVPDRVTGQSVDEPSINPQPLPPGPRPDGMSPRPRPTRTPRAIVG